MTLLDQLSKARSAAFGRFFEEPFQRFAHDLSKSLVGHLYYFCRMLSKFSSAQDDALKKEVPRLQTLMRGSSNAAAVEGKRTDIPDPASGSRSLVPDATTGPFSSDAPDTGVLCARFSLTKPAKEGNVPAKCDLEH